MNKLPVVLALCMGLAVVGLVSCSTTPEPVVNTRPPAAQSPVYHPPVASAPVSPAPPAVYKPMDDDQCGASRLQHLVGQPRTEIPVPLDPATRRVVCSSCIVTQEYRADRQTIIFNTETGIIDSVKCG